MIEDWKKDILTEKNLRQVFAASNDFPKSKFNKTVYFITTTLSVIISLFFIYLNDAVQSADIARYVAEICFSLTVQILGFLIGGFAIFATISNPLLMIRLTKAKMPNYDISVFKYIFFNFLSVFYVYLVTLSLSVSIKISSNIDIRSLFLISEKISNEYITVINCIVFVIVVHFLTLSIVRLKSFIWNIYQAFLIFLIASDATAYEEEKE